ncbi:MFS transporter [Bacillus sp. AFS073361]|uniref:MFS transporter n=1 Tax=Bacillus salipaludis TaxID=2547811 RepID=A0A4R5VJQ6_9BACI|nr:MULTISPECIES: MFS transporter [Bacillus]PFP17550.1 MFS transporter [Bacillus sp. AFS073361]TDK58109.1 MFS transporter [Bacillus salipaludis]
MISKRTRNWILALLFLGWSLGNVDRYIMNYAVLSITKDLHLSASTTGLLLSSFFAGYAIMQMPGGWLADRFGPRKVLLAAVISWSIFTGLTGAAWSLASMVIIRFLFGIGEGGFQPASSKIISLTFPKAERGRAMSIMLSSGGIITLIIPIASATLLTTIGWRTTFIIIGSVGAIIAALYWYFIKLPDNTEDKINHTAVLSQKGIFRSLFKIPMIWNLIIAYFCIYAVNWGLAAWIPTYLVKNRGLDLMSLGWVQTIPGLTMLVGIYLGGYIIDKLPKGRERLVGSFSCACIGILLYLMFTASSVTSFITYQAIVNLFIAFVITLLPAIVLKQLPSSVTGTAMGIANTGGQLAGFVTPMAIGFIVDAFNGSFNAAFWMLIGFAIVCIVALLTLSDKKVDLLKKNEQEAIALDA